MNDAKHAGVVTLTEARACRFTKLVATVGSSTETPEDAAELADVEFAAVGLADAELSVAKTE